jgi:hypothetical protein
MAGPRYRVTDGVTVCEDCGVVVALTGAHTRFHSILSGHAWALAILKNRHLSDAVHGRYDVAERIDSKTFDSWSGDALAEVIAGHDLPVTGDTRRPSLDSG